MQFRSSLKAQIMECLVVAMLIGTLVAAGMAMMSSGKAPLQAAIWIGFAIALIAFGFYVSRYFLKGAHLVEVTEAGLFIAGRSHQSTVYWAEVRRARHHNQLGLTWTFTLDGGPVTLRDDGFTSKQWDELSLLIGESLKKYGTPIQRDGYGEIFHEEEDDSQKA